jgi:hypothetical protein
MMRSQPRQQQLTGFLRRLPSDVEQATFLESLASSPETWQMNSSQSDYRDGRNAHLAVKLDTGLIAGVDLIATLGLRRRGAPR